MIIATREQLFALVGYDPRKEFRRSHKAVVAAHSADRQDGSPDHAIRIKAAEINLKLAVPEYTDAADPSRPVNVVIVLAGSANGHDARAALSGGGITLHLAGDAGQEA